MTVSDTILLNTSHRPFEVPDGRWQYYQEWNKVLFFHWKVPIEILRHCVPSKFNIDSFDGEYYVSLVAFTMQNMRTRNLPPIKLISDFHEINLRTYIDNDNKKGIYFLTVEAGKYLSTIIAKTLSGLPYEKAEIDRTDKRYYSVNNNKYYRLNTKFEVHGKISNKTDLDTWLTERYCLYLDNHDKAYRYDIHHKEWKLKNVDIKQFALYYKIDNLVLCDLQPHLVHYSDGVKVLVWQKQPI